MHVSTFQNVLEIIDISSENKFYNNTVRMTETMSYSINLFCWTKCFFNTIYSNEYFLSLSVHHSFVFIFLYVNNETYDSITFERFLYLPSQ